MMKYMKSETPELAKNLPDGRLLGVVIICED